ncbi:hypothetical protein KY343_04795 [Candidatus Woesearchaeota archaeon]|nr:hypothetical protein [Candidatus Woesearchaeota archaeon]
MKKATLEQTAFKAAKSLYSMFPIILGIILLISLVNVIIPKTFYSSVFKGNILTDSFIGSFIGSISAGSPATSYIIGGELLKQGISLIAVTAFLVAWVTVGLVQFPAESMLLGKKFAVIRNIIAFIFSMIVAVITVLILGVL